MPKKEPKNIIIQTESPEITNAELQHLLERAMVRFENWKLEVNKNPNPRTVHTLKNIMAIIDTITDIATTKTRYSYKLLSKQMAGLSHEVAELNLAIMNALLDDDFLDDKESAKINTHLGRVIQAALLLIRIVQNSFGKKREIEDKHIEELR